MQSILIWARIGKGDTCLTEGIGYQEEGSDIGMGR